MILALAAVAAGCLFAWRAGQRRQSVFEVQLTDLSTTLNEQSRAVADLAAEIDASVVTDNNLVQEIIRELDADTRVTLEAVKRSNRAVAHLTAQLDGFEARLADANEVSTPWKLGMPTVEALGYRVITTTYLRSDIDLILSPSKSGELVWLDKEGSDKELLHSYVVHRGVVAQGDRTPFTLVSDWHRRYRESIGGKLHGDPVCNWIERHEPADDSYLDDLLGAFG